MVKCILTILFLSVTVISQNQTFKRETILQTYSQGYVVIKATRKSIVVFDDRGRQVERVTEQHGKIKTRAQLKKGEYLIVTDFDRKEFRASEPKITEIQPVMTVTKGAPQMIYPSWRPGTTIEVYSQGFYLEERAAIERAISSWNVGIVTFKYRGEGQGQLTIKRGTELTGMCAYSDLTSVDGILTEGVMFIDSRIKRPSALESVVAHEMGHAMGLSDCRPCQSVMRPFRSRDKSNGFTAPTRVDLSVLRQ